MPTIMNTQGQLVDMTTGEIVGRAEGAPIAVEPRKAGAPEQVTEGADKVKGLVNNLSWGFNSALFSLPDAAQRVIGKGLGLDENQVFQFAKFFNRGEVAPKNSGERYSRAIGEGIGNALPVTGILGYMAATRPMVTAAQPAAGILRGIADDTIKFIQKSPAQAAAMDVAFGAAWEALRQAVEENVDDANPSKALYKELLPTAAFVGMPLAMSGGLGVGKKLLSVSPTAKALAWTKEQVTGSNASLRDIEKEVLDAAPSGWRLPLIRIVPQKLIQKAEGKLSTLFGEIAKSEPAQASLAALEAALAKPHVGEAGFIFDAAEKTMYTPLVEEKRKLLQQLGPKELESVIQRTNHNIESLNNLFSTLAPQARMEATAAFQAAQADRLAFFENLLRQKKDMTDAEVLAVAERLGPQNLDMLNNEIRGVIMARMEADNSMRQNILSRMGLKQATAPDGTPLPTREQGKSLFQAQDMEDAVLALIKKYKPERPSMRTPMPEPIRLLDNFVQGQLRQRERLEGQALTGLVDDALAEQIGAMGRDLDPEVLKAMRDSVMTLVKGEKPRGGRRTPGLAELAPKPDAQGNIAIPAIIPGRKIIINPEQLRQDAARIAESSTKIDLNMPEALDYLTAAQRFRNDSLSSYNAAMMKGRTRQTDAQRIMDTGNSVFNDVEKLVLGHTPRLKGEYDAMKTMIDDYKQVYDSSLPLLMSQGKRGGQEYLLPNEDLLRNAFKNAENLRSVTAILGPDEQSADLLMKGTVDWLRSKNVVNKDGLVDPKMLRSVLDKNRNIVEALPDNIQAKLKDEVALADDYVKRLGELDRRVVTAQDNELDRVLAKAVRPEADTRLVLQDALKDPAIMRKLVDAMSPNPEMVNALRRSVYDIATQGAQGGGALKSFLDNNERSLKVLFGGTEHLDNLKTLADLQRRVYAFANVTGQIPAFESMDEALRRTFGTGIQFLTTTAREAMVGRISPETGALALMVRMTGSLENQLYKRIFTRALESEEFAKQITHISTPKDAAKVAKALEEIGIPRSAITGKEMAAIRGTAQAAGDVMQEGKQAPVAGMAGQPVVSRGTASQMLRQLPPAPPTRGTNFNPRMPTTPQVQQGSGMGQIPLMYPAMFPNDPISGLLQQRQAMIQGPRQ